MAEDSVHKRKRSKNLAVLALIFAWCVLIWLITMVRMAHAEDMSGFPPQPDIHASEIATPGPFRGLAVYNTDYIFFHQRGSHQQNIAHSLEEMLTRGANHQAAMTEMNQGFHQRGIQHQETMNASLEEMLARGRTHMQLIDQNAQTFREQGARHQAQLATNPEKWWQGWESRLLPEDYGNSRQ
jgi:hypothetical protein